MKYYFFAALIFVLANSSFADTLIIRAVVWNSSFELACAGAAYSCASDFNDYRKQCELRGWKFSASTCQETSRGIEGTAFRCEYQSSTACTQQ